MNLPRTLAALEDCHLQGSRDLVPANIDVDPVRILEELGPQDLVRCSLGGDLAIDKEGESVAEACGEGQVVQDSDDCSAGLLLDPGP